MRALRVVGALLVVAALAACSDGDDTSETKVLELTDEGPQTCLDVPEDLPPEVSKLPVIDCNLAHTHEIYAVVPYESDDEEADDSVFPGLETLDGFAERVCVIEFESYVRISVFDSSLAFTWLTPTLSSWNDHDDRAILCVLNDPTGLDLPPGSKKGSQG